MRPHASKRFETITLPYAKAWAELNRRKAVSAKDKWPSYDHTMTKINHGQFEVRSELKGMKWKFDEVTFEADKAQLTSIRPTINAEVITDTSSGVLPFFNMWQKTINDIKNGKS